jgi:hypothetical protein
MIGLEIETTNWNKAVDAYQRATGESFKEIVKDEAKQVVGWLIKLTPPRTASVGKKRIKDDINKLFVPIAENNKIRVSAYQAYKENLPNLPWENIRFRDGRMGTRIRTLLEKQDNVALEKIFNNFANANFRGDDSGEIIQDATKDIYYGRRTKKGGLRTKPRYLIQKSVSKKQILKKQQAKVGRMKAGWGHAGRRLGVRMDAWVRNNIRGKDGSYTDLTNQSDPLVIIENNAPGIGWNNSEKGFVKIVLSRRLQALATKAKVKLRLAKQKAKL